MDVMDPAIRRGTFRITTVSGSVYTVIADKNIARGVTVSGGSHGVKLDKQLMILDDVVSVGESMIFKKQGQDQPYAWTTPVETIEKIG